MVRQVAQKVNIPFTVGGGISSLSDVSALLGAGADKVSINSAAVIRPDLINELAANFGSECIMVAIDARNDGEFPVYIPMEEHSQRPSRPCNGPKK